MGLKLLLTHRREQGLVLKVSDLIIFFQKKRKRQIQNLRRITDFCSDWFLNKNVCGLQDSLEGQAFRKGANIKINLNQETKIK